MVEFDLMLKKIDMTEFYKECLFNDSKYQDAFPMVYVNDMPSDLYKDGLYKIKLGDGKSDFAFLSSDNLYKRVSEEIEHPCVPEHSADTLTREISSQEIIHWYGITAVICEEILKIPSPQLIFREDYMELIENGIVLPAKKMSGKDRFISLARMLMYVKYDFNPECTLIDRCKIIAIENMAEIFARQLYYAVFGSNSCIQCEVRDYCDTKNIITKIEDIDINEHTADFLYDILSDIII